MNFCLTACTGYSLVTVSDNKTIGLSSFLSPGDEIYIAIFLGT